MRMKPTVLKSTKNCRVIFNVYLIFTIIVLIFLGTYLILYYWKSVDMDEKFANFSLFTPNMSQMDPGAQENVTGITLEEELKKNPDCPIENFYSIREWLQNEPHLPKLSDERLFQFLFSCFYDVENTKKCIEIFLQIKSNSPEFYCNRDISDPDLQKNLSYNTIFTMPVLTPEKHYRITFLRIDSVNPSHFDFIKIVKLFFMAYDAELYLNGTARGHIIVFDFKNCGFRQIMKTNLDTWKKVIQLTQSGLPVRRKTLHILNANYFIYKFAQVLKPFINPDIYKTIHFHRPDDLEDFYKYVPKECLPSDYGGFLESADKLKKKFENDIRKLRYFFNQDDKEIICKHKKL